MSLLSKLVIREGHTKSASASHCCMSHMSVGMEPPSRDWLMPQRFPGTRKGAKSPSGEHSSTCNIEYSTYEKKSNNERKHCLLFSNNKNTLFLSHKLKIPEMKRDQDGQPFALSHPYTQISLIKNILYCPHSNFLRRLL